MGIHLVMVVIMVASVFFGVFVGSRDYSGESPEKMKVKNSSFIIDNWKGRTPIPDQDTGDYLWGKSRPFSSITTSKQNPYKPAQMDEYMNIMKSINFVLFNCISKLILFCL